MGKRALVPGGPEEGLRESDEHEAEHKEATLPLMVAGQTGGAWQAVLV